MLSLALTVRCALLGLAASALFVGPLRANPIPADGYVVHSGDWEGGGYSDEAGRFLFCAAYGPTREGDDLSFTLYRDGTLLLSLGADLWPGKREGGQKVRMFVDDAAQTAVSERVADLLVFEVPRDRAFYAALKETDGITFFADPAFLHLTLDGHARVAVGQLEDCLQHFSGLDLTATPKSIVTDSASPGERTTGYRIHVGSWSGGGYTDEHGFSLCGIARRFDSQALVIGLARDRSLTIVLAEKGWERSIVGGERNLVLRVDNTAERWTSAQGIEGKLVANLGPDTALFEALRRGSRLVVEGAPEEISFALKPDMSEAMDALEHCFSHHTGLDIVGNPARGAATTAAADAGKTAATRTETPPTPLPALPAQATAPFPYEAVAREILSASGYADPVVIGMEQQPGDYGDFKVGWLGSGKPVGFLAAAQAPDRVDYWAQFSIALARAAQICGAVGEPEFDQTALSATGATIYSGHWNCSEDGVVAVYFASSVIDGEMLVFLHFAHDDDRSLARQITANLRQNLRRM